MQAIKAVGDYELDVLGIPFGGPSDKDADGEYFTAKTQLHLDKWPTPAVVYHHGYGDDKRPAREPQYIGRVTGHEVKADGVWFRVALDKAHTLARRVWDAAKRGVAYASSGSVLHLVRYGAGGEILEWPVAELSVFETDTGKRPANKRAVALPVMKAVYEAAGLSLPDDIEPEPEGDATGEGRADGQPEQSAEPVKAVPGNESGNRQETFTMDTEMKGQIADAIAEAIKAHAEAQAQAAAAETQRQAEIADAVKAAQDKWEAEAAAGRRLPGGGAPTVRKYAALDRYDNLSGEDLAFMVGVLHSAKVKARSEFGPHPEALKALAIRMAESREERHAPIKAAMERKGLSLKANELNQSTLDDYGDEWVALGYSNSLWQKVRELSQVVNRVPTVEIPQGVESLTLPIQTTDPVFYKVAQASAQDSSTLGKITYTHTSSKMGTEQRVLSVGKLGARVAFSGELEEDSMLPWVTELRSTLETTAGEVLESLIINGDTATSATTNINDIGGTPGGTEYWLVLDGFRKLALVTNTGNSRSATTFDEMDFIETLKLMGLGGKYAADKRAVSFIVDMWTGWKSAEIAALKTRDVFGQPTLESGRLMNIWGVDVITSPQMHDANLDATYGLKANTAGKTDLDTAANNTTGAILAVRWDQWRMGWKRRIRFEVDRVPQADASEIICNMRVGLQYRDTDAAAISYNVTL